VALSLRSRQRGSHVIDVWQTAAAQIDWPSSVRGGRLVRLVHDREPLSEGLIHECLQRRLELAPQLLDAGCNVIVEGESGPHASDHKTADVVMSIRQWALGRE
jgi:hypothetical protein